MKERPVPDISAVRARLAADIASGKTVSLSAEELAHPEVRKQLPQLLDELARANANGAPPPVRIPGITLLGEIGHGGMSTVYLARQDALDRHVALKIAPRWLASVKKMQSRLLQEARAMARLSHPNIVVIHDILEIDDTVAIAMDWIDGLTLSALLAHLPPQPADDDVRTIERALGWPATSIPLAASAIEFFVRVIRDIARAVQHVHGAGLLHLDIKPSNILVRRNGTPMLADFGVVREIDLAATHTRTFAGTPVYAAPEQLQRDDAGFGPHTDVYGLGMTLYEMLARTQPLRDLDLTRVLGTVLGGRIPPLAKRTPIAADLANIVHKAIAPEPEHRYPTAQALADDLTAFLEHRPVSARPLSRTQRLRRWARNEPWKASLAAALLVLLPALLVLGTYLLLQLPRIEQQEIAERRAKANYLKQDAYLLYFVTHSAGGDQAHMLREAVELDREPNSLACMLAMMHEEGDPTIPELLRANSETVAAHLGLRAFADKHAAHRAFFTDDEAARLRTSTDGIDKVVLALDRIFRAEDTTLEEHYAEAEAALDEASLLTGEDALFSGLRLWAAGRARTPDRYKGITRALGAKWPTDPRMLAWIYYSEEPIDHAGAIEFAEGLRKRQPDRVESYEMLAGDACRRAKPDEALAFIAGADAAGAGSDRLTLYRHIALVQRDGKPAAERALREVPSQFLTARRRLTFTRAIDPGAARRLREDLLRSEPNSPMVLAALFRDALDQDDTEHAERAWERWRTLQPDRRALHFDRFRMLLPTQDWAGAARMLVETTPPLAYEAWRFEAMCRTLALAKEWPTLLRYARRWLDSARDSRPPEAFTYAAIGALRQGERELGAHFLANALSGPASRENWYGQALLEDAWLRVDPDAPPAWRSVELASMRVRAFEAFCKEAKRPYTQGPWTRIVRSEVLFANDERDEALALVGHSPPGEKTEIHAPADFPERLRAAIQRYRDR